jgi:hypothetical protein
VYDVATRLAVAELVGVENLEDRWPSATDQIDPVAFAYLRKLYPAPKQRAAVKKSAARRKKH